MVVWLPIATVVIAYLALLTLGFWSCYIGFVVVIVRGAAKSSDFIATAVFFILGWTCSVIAVGAWGELVQDYIRFFS